MINLTGQVALVTGGSRAIARAIALRLAEAGADVVLNFTAGRPAVDTATEHMAARGRRVAAVLGDTNEPDDVQSMLEWVGATFGRLDILVSCPACEIPGELLAMTPEALNAAWNGPARSLVLLVQAALPWLAASDRGKVIAIAGDSESGLEAAVRQLAGEVRDRGINVNAVRESHCDFAAGLVMQQRSPSLQAGGTATSPGAQHQGIADVAVWLSSNLSDGMQGQMLMVDGGYSLSQHGDSRSSLRRRHEIGMA